MLRTSMIHQGGRVVSYVKLLEPVLITTAFTEGLLCASTVLTEFCMNYVL